MLSSDYQHFLFCHSLKGLGDLLQQSFPLFSLSLILQQMAAFRSLQRSAFLARDAASEAVKIEEK